ncbi:TPA: sodium/proton antiporter NhaB [Mannheimia haemolytica]|uniref:Na(+)/H(+) antiporter NhaB n=1 Tax=Mannheimia haemolytica TaxID=75985 RepID=A0A378NB06_MANHA|nr:sodium/proton antiporter NhaB [Mannheimia haemolytica]AJE07662.1 sodium/proton antiporter NhaB [Mannheimia haemolytica USDA-ARS-USMARC-184]EEY11225.1 sodium/proton antiporter [Mannheimia haemolytica serotype A2 str. OVINE]EEY11884.1 sodium/proton antiporter [Mannheimia haemolytica serotype A2 str. BOVINE]KYL18416.1 sodium/proton antiporter [Mannheimia haemolytica]KYL23872.1 sodium/proton antiporter [Mannheimia haemolytica]
MSSIDALFKSFLGKSPEWYKLCILAFLIINPLIYFFINPFVAGWFLVAEFIFTLSMALKCYPLQPGGLLAIEAVVIGMTNPHHIKEEIMANFDVILLLMFMVAGIYFMKQLLLYIFTKLLVAIHSKKILSLSFCLSAAFLSAFLDALTVIAVIISVGTGFYGVYHKVASGNNFEDSTDITNDEKIISNKEILEQFRGFLRSLLMHAGIGSALGGVMTMVGEPQNLIIASQAEWGFIEFLLRVLPVSLPVLICGIATCFLVEKYKLFGYGDRLPSKVWVVLARYSQLKEQKMTKQDRLKMLVQAIAGIWLIIGLALHLADVGIIGLTIIIICTAFCGITDEHTLGKAFQESMPFTALLIVFFSVVAVIIDLKLFEPIIAFVLSAEPHSQLSLFYIFNGLLSMISDNVFVGTVYINEAKTALDAGIIDREQFDLIAVAINTGTNLPSVATPNGQAAFLFLLTSSFAPLIKLSYGRMVYMALPYTIVLSIVGFLGLEFLLPSMTEVMINWGWFITR